MTELILMAISGLTGAFSVWVVTQFLIPQIVAIISKAPKLSQNWQYRDSADGPIVGNATLKQYGTRIKLHAKRVLSRSGNPDKREFTYNGKIKGRDVILVYEAKNSGGYISGAVVLHLDNSLCKMDGRTSYFSNREGCVSANPIFYESV